MSANAPHAATPGTRSALFAGLHDVPPRRFQIGTGPRLPLQSDHLNHPKGSP